MLQLARVSFARSIKHRTRRGGSRHGCAELSTRGNDTVFAGRFPFLFLVFANPCLRAFLLKRAPNSFPSPIPNNVSPAAPVLPPGMWIVGSIRRSLYIHGVSWEVLMRALHTARWRRASHSPYDCTRSRWTYSNLHFTHRPPLTQQTNYNLYEGKRETKLDGENKRPRHQRPSEPPLLSRPRRHDGSRGLPAAATGPLLRRLTVVLEEIPLPLPDGRDGRPLGRPALSDGRLSARFGAHRRSLGSAQVRRRHWGLPQRRRPRRGAQRCRLLPGDHRRRGRLSSQLARVRPFLGAIHVFGVAVRERGAITRCSMPEDVEGLSLHRVVRAAPLGDWVR